MKLSAINSYNILVNNNKTHIICCAPNNQNSNIPSYTAHNKFMSANEIYFKGQIIKPKTIAFTDIPKILSEAEYDEVLSRLKKDRTWWSIWSPGNATKFEHGILPYAGEQDRSVVINTYMRSGKVLDPRFSESILRDYVRVMDYALQEFDKTYGKYEGLVYRCGKMDNPSKNYVSTAREQRGLIAVIDSKECYHKPFYIIYTKHGHKIEDLQQKVSHNFVHKSETEILLDPCVQYEEITEITPEMQELKNSLRESIYDDYGHVPELNTTFLREI